MNKRDSGKQKRTEKAAEIKHFILLFGLLFVFWLLLSGRTELKFILMGLASAGVIAWITTPLLRLPAVKGEGHYLAFNLPGLKFVVYAFWLVWQIILANIDLAKIILHPKMDIQPKIIIFDKEMSNPMAHTVLGNSITLTPGTVTVDIIDGKRYVIHALTDAAAAALIPQEGEGEMISKVESLMGA